jgi:HSP20 family protein
VCLLRPRGDKHLRAHGQVARRVHWYRGVDAARPAGIHPKRRPGAQQNRIRRRTVMTLIRWTPTRNTGLLDLRSEMDRLFDNFVGTRPAPTQGSDFISPPVDIEETPEAFVLRADLPGVSQKDVKVSFTGDTLVLRGERKRESEKHEGSLHRTERVHGAFERTFTLTAPVRGDQIKATYRDGVLEINVPKAEEARVREIEVQVG